MNDRTPSAPPPGPGRDANDAEAIARAAYRQLDQATTFDLDEGLQDVLRRAGADRAGADEAHIPGPPARAEHEARRMRARAPRGIVPSHPADRPMYRRAGAAILIAAVVLAFALVMMLNAPLWAAVPFAAAAGGIHVYASGVRRVPTSKVGLVYRRFGSHHPDDRYPVRIHGSPGPQAAVLKPNRRYFRPAFLYGIKYVPQTHVPPGTMGLVQAKVGEIPLLGTRLAPFTECDHFQDGEAFLRNGGWQGMQMQVLASGYYDINPHIFDVITVDNVGDHRTLGLTPGDLRETEIEVGGTGVVITHLGAPGGLDEDGVAPRVPGHDSFQCPWVFLDNGGQLGVQAETLPAGGFYAINPWFAHVVKIPTRNLVLEWSRAPKAEANLDVSLDQIVLDVQGYTVCLGMKQTLCIPEEAAPRLVCWFGNQGRQGRGGQRTPVQRFIEKVLVTTVTAYFRKISARYQILEFITKYDELGAELSREVRDALAVHGIVAVSTSLDEFDCQPQDMYALRKAIALERNKLAALQSQLANSSIEQKRLEVDVARRKVELVEIQGLIELLGSAQIATERVLAQWKEMGVPQTVAVGGDNDLANAILQAVPFTQARDMLLAMAKESGRQLGKAEAEEPQAIEPADEG